MNKIKEMLSGYFERNQEYLPLNVVGRIAIVSGMGGLVMKMLEDAPTSEGVAPLAVAAAGCVIELATKSSQSESS